MVLFVNFNLNENTASNKAKRYTIGLLIYIIHTFSREFRLLFLSALK